MSPAGIMWFGLVSLFPEMFAAMDCGIPGKAKRQGLIELQCWNPRDFTHDRHRTVDDRPYGGGPGMVMLAEPLQAAIIAAKVAAPCACKTVYLSPQGRQLDHQGVRELAANPGLLLVCGRYEGIDERVISTLIDEEWSLGDFVLSGGELAAMAMIDAITRQLPEALGHAHSAEQDSFVDGLLDYPHYTRPITLNGIEVPEVLTSGNHEQIRRWRRQQALVKTWQKRPDLFEKLQLTAEDQQLFNEGVASD